jgi:hypothetical protein
MSVERRYSLIRHEHTIQDFQDWGLLGTTADWWGKITRVLDNGVMEIGKYIDFHETDDDAGDYDYRLTVTSGRLYTSGDIQTGRVIAQGATGALPSLGYANESTSLVLSYSGDFAYGLLAGVLNSGNAWIQVGRFDGTATAYNLSLQPLGGSVHVGNMGGGVTNIYGTNGNIVDFVTNHATTAYLRLFTNSGATLNSYWYTDASGHGLLGSNGAWDLVIDQASNAVTMYGNVVIPSGSGYFFDGGGTNYIGNNTTSSYSTLLISSSRGGYSGFYCAHSGVSMMWDSSGNGGPYRESNSRWFHYYNVSTDCTGFGGTSTSGSYRIYVTGSAYATGTWTASDGRKKENIRTLKGALDVVSMMRGVEYTWKADANVGQDPDVAHIGVIAQEVQEVVPSAVHYAADSDSYAVDYNGLVGLLIQAVKELKEEVYELKTERRR